MKTISISIGIDPKKFKSAQRRRVRPFSLSGGLSVTPTVGWLGRFTVTHVATGCAVPRLVGLRLLEACAIAEILGAAFPWEFVSDTFFFRTLSRPHQMALVDCIMALLEMFGAE